MKLMNWFRRETGFAGKLVSLGNWFRWETGFAGQAKNIRQKYMCQVHTCLFLDIPFSFISLTVELIFNDE